MIRKYSTALYITEDKKGNQKFIPKFYFFFFLQNTKLTLINKIL